MITRSRDISGKKFVLSCADPLKPQADWLLELLEKIENQRGRGFLEDGVSLQVGWSRLTIRREGDLMVILEPNFCGDPFRETNDNLTCTLSVQAEQNSVLSALRLEGAPVSFQDKVILSKGSIEKPHVYLERQTPKKGDSGWYIGEVDQPANELSAVYVYQLLRLRPVVMKALALPKGYMVVFERDHIEAILDDNDTCLSLAGLNREDKRNRSRTASE